MLIIPDLCAHKDINRNKDVMTVEETANAASADRHIRCQSTRLGQAWWLKASVRRYVELSSTIKQDYCHSLDLVKDRVWGNNVPKMCVKIHKGELMTVKALNNITKQYYFKLTDTAHNWKIKQNTFFMDHLLTMKGIIE